jgi:uncharacterized membrane protein YeiH
MIGCWESCWKFARTAGILSIHEPSGVVIMLCFTETFGLVRFCLFTSKTEVMENALYAYMGCCGCFIEFLHQPFIYSPLLLISKRSIQLGRLQLT